MMTITLELVCVSLVVFWLSRCVKVVSEGTRLVIFLDGQFKRVAGPGLIFVTPTSHQVVTIHLNQDIPEWKKLDADTLQRRIREVATSRLAQQSRKSTAS